MISSENRSRFSGSCADIQIRRVTPADAALYRGIRLEGLQRNPEAFGSTFEFESAQADSWFAERLASSEVLGAWHDGDLVGIVGFRVQQGVKVAHKGVLWGMYVKPAFRKAGAARRLVDALIDIASTRVELVQLEVWEGNAAARRLYTGAGFVDYGIEVNALKQNGVYYNEVLMAKSLAGRT
jgi:ribosomal protein S18 acetylase RimI-like enzyme